MKIYVSHSTAFDYESELYEPLRRKFVAQHEIILPHDSGADFNSSDTIKTSDVVLAEVSFPSTGQGIELGWANAAGVPIVCIHKMNAAPSGALNYITSDFLSYVDETDMVSKISQLLNTK
jgi:nucleoside 2-deoxyribosyltransferase